MKALIVEDSLQYRILLKRILTTEFNADVFEAQDGYEALARIATDKPDIIFLDYEMPHLNGAEMLRIIRSEPANKDIPVIVVTSHNDGMLVREFLSYGISAFILKPYTSADIVKRLSSILAEKTSAENDSGVPSV